MFKLKKRIKTKGLTLEQKEENIFFKNKLKRQTSYFNVDKWKDEYKKAQNYKKNICSFPSIDFRKTFQNYFDKENGKFKNNFQTPIVIENS